MKGLICFKYKKLFITLALLFVPFFILLNAGNAGAVSVNSIVASQSSFSKNFDPTILYQTLNSQSLPAYVLSTDANMTGMWDYSLNFVFNNPVQNHSGTGFSHSIRFTLTSNGDYLNSNILSYMATARIGFENINVNLPYCTSSFGVVSMSSNSIRFEIVNSCPYGSYSSTQNFSNVLSVINYHPESLFWCANDNPNQLCPSNPIYITLSDVEYYYKTLTSESDSYNETIINQNQTIINQNQQQIDQENQDREDLQNTSDSAENDASSAAASLNNAKTGLFSVIANFVNIVIHPPASNCVIDADMGNMDLGDIDLCQLSLPAPFAVIGTLLIIGFLIPLGYSVIMTVLSMLKGATEG